MNIKKSDQLFMVVMTIALFALLSLVLTACTAQITDSGFSRVKSVAASWIMQSSTYAFDGQNLTFKSVYALESLPQQYVVVYAFISTHEGYGDRSGQTLSEKPTNHEIVLTLQEERVVSAIIDDDWDELNNRRVDEFRIPESNDTVTLLFEPKACVETPWEILAKNSSVRWIKAPTDTEMITTLYAERYGVAVHTVEKIQIADAVCLACGVCGTGYQFKIIVDEGDKVVFIADGWVMESPSVQIANPASVNCIENNGTLTIRDEADGQVAYCILPDGKECEEWAFFRGTCT